MECKTLALAIAVLGLCAAAPFSIPSDQPICNLYGLIKVFGTVVGVLVASYGGFILSTTHEINDRNQAKSLIGGVAVGLIVIWLAPLVITNLVGASSICGWS